VPVTYKKPKPRRRSDWNSRASGIRSEVARHNAAVFDADIPDAAKVDLGVDLSFLRNSDLKRHFLRRKTSDAKRGELERMLRSAPLLEEYHSSVVLRAQKFMRPTAAELYMLRLRSRVNGLKRVSLATYKGNIQELAEQYQKVEQELRAYNTGVVPKKRIDSAGLLMPLFKGYMLIKSKLITRMQGIPGRVELFRKKVFAEAAIRKVSEEASQNVCEIIREYHEIYQEMKALGKSFEDSNAIAFVLGEDIDVDLAHSQEAWSQAKRTLCGLYPILKSWGKSK